MATNTIKEKMAQLTSANQDLNAILRSTEANVQQELADAAQRTDYVKAYMEINSTLAKSVNEYLEKNQTYTEKFKTMLKQRSGSSFGRFMRGSKLTSWMVGDSFQPGSVAQVIMDMYTNMILQKDAVAKQVKLLETRRTDLFTQTNTARDAVKAEQAKLDEWTAKYDQINGAYQTARSIFDADGLVGDNDLTQLTAHYAKLGIDAEKVAQGQKPERLNLLALTDLVTDLSREYTTAEENKTQAEIGLKAAFTSIKAYDVQKEQFDMYVKSSKVLLWGLEADLKYSKTLVENQAILANAQDTVTKAIDAFVNYRETINQTLVLNSIGVQVMARQTAEVLNKDTWNDASILQAKALNADADQYWDEFKQKQSAAADELNKRLREANQPTA
jgi:hypothetical protein